MKTPLLGCQMAVNKKMDRMGAPLWLSSDLTVLPQTCVFGHHCGVRQDCLPRKSRRHRGSWIDVRWERRSIFGRLPHRDLGPKYVDLGVGAHTLLKEREERPDTEYSVDEICASNTKDKMISRSHNPSNNGDCVPISGHSCPFLTSQWVGTSAALEPFVLTTLRIGEEGGMAGHHFTEQRSPIRMCGKVASENNLPTKTRTSVANTPGTTCRAQFPVSDMTELESYLKWCMCSLVHEVSTVDKRNES